MLVTFDIVECIMCGMLAVIGVIMYRVVVRHPETLPGERREAAMRCRGARATAAMCVSGTLEDASR